MSLRIASDTNRAVIGTGLTGISIARFLAEQNIQFDWFDSRENPPNLPAVQAEFPQQSIRLGPLARTALLGYREILLSPGIARQEPYVQAAVDQGAVISGDIDLFNDRANAPVIAITGSNGKSTVTCLVAEMARACGLNVRAGGNLGVPALELLEEGVDLYVLELSSFQLETCERPQAVAATVLNVSADHMDRYSGLIAYYQTKQRVYRNAAAVIWNRDDALTQPLVKPEQRVISFGLDEPDLAQLGLLFRKDQLWFAKGLTPLRPVSKAKLIGRHNQLNILAALALCDAMNLPLLPALDAALEFPGLPHRCVLVGEHKGVRWINDSKATNVGATVAALNSVGDGKNVVLIAGGQGKQQDFSELTDALAQHVKTLVLIGEDGPEIGRHAPKPLATVYSVSMSAAVIAAAAAAEAGDCVLLSPACASFDQFKSYQDRGQQFADQVSALGEVVV